MKNEMISVILLEKISKLGNIGQEVKVKNGFARNYLIPNKKAIRASEENKKFFEQKSPKNISNNTCRCSIFAAIYNTLDHFCSKA